MGTQIISPTTAKEERINATNSEEGTTAKEESTTALDEGTTAKGENTTVKEENTTAKEENKIALGENTKAKTENTIGIEESTTAKAEKDYVKSDASAYNKEELKSSPTSKETSTVVTSLHEKEQNILPFLNNDELKNIGAAGKGADDDFEPTPYQMMNDEEEYDIEPTPYKMISSKHRRRMKRQ